MHATLTCCYACLAVQTYSDIVGILKSLGRVKGVRIQIKAHFWGEEYAASADKPKFSGTIDRWANAKEKAAMYVMWEGYSRNQLAPLDKMDQDAHGDSLELVLLPYADGREPPTLQAARPTPQPQAARAAGGEEQEQQDDDEGDDDDDDEPAAGDVVDVNGQSWTLRPATYVNTDARMLPRTKPSLNGGGRALHSMMALFNFLLPPKWEQIITQHTNPLLEGTTPTNQKLQPGELRRFIGYMISIALHSGIPVEKMWAKTQLSDSSAPPPHMGRWGMSENRFSLLRSRLRFGPSDDASFDQNEWCFVEELVDTFNKHMCESITAGWLLGADESMSAWRGKVSMQGAFHSMSLILSPPD